MLRAVYHNGKQIILSVKDSKLYTLVKKVLSSTKELEEEEKLLQTGVMLEEGPLLKAGLFYIGEKSYLILMLHQLVADEKSWRILVEDFKTGYKQWKEGRKIELPPKTASFKEWSELQREYAKSGELGQEMDY